MTLQVDSICDVRPIGDFVDARIALVGFKSVSDFTRMSGLTRPTVERLLDAKTLKETRSYRATLETVAQKLGFGEWADLVTAWEEGDVKRGLDLIPVQLRLDVWQHAMAEARKKEMTIDDWIEERILGGKAVVITRRKQSALEETAPREIPQLPPHQPLGGKGRK